MRQFLPLLLAATAGLGARFFPHRNPPLLPEQAGRRVTETPSRPVPTDSSPDEIINDLISALTDGVASQTGALELLAALDIKIQQDPSGTWQELLTSGERGKPLRRWVAGRMAFFHGAALMASAAARQEYADFPYLAFIGGCAMRPGVMSEVEVMLSWELSPKGGMPGRAEALRALGKAWAIANRTADFPWKSPEYAPLYRKLLLAGVEEGLAESGIGQRTAPFRDRSSWRYQSGIWTRAGDGDGANLPLSCRGALQLLERSGGITKALASLKGSGNRSLESEIIALGLAGGFGKVEEVMAYAKSAPHVMDSLAVLLGRTSPEEGMNWIRQMGKSDPNTGGLLGKFLSGWASSHPADAMKACMNDPLLASLPQEYYGMVIQRNNVDPGAVTSLLETTGAGTPAPAAFRAALQSEVVNRSPEYYQNIIGEGRDAGLPGSLRTRLAASLSRKQGEEGARWAIAHIPGVGPVELAEAATKGLDPLTGSKFANTLEAGPLKDGAAVALAALSAASEPASAFEWANSISEPGLRGKTVIRTLERMALSGLPLGPYLERAGIQTWPVQKSENQ